jgi:hypothetical protein
MQKGLSPPSINTATWNENSIPEYARTRKLEEATVGLSLLCSLPVDVVERALVRNSEMVLILATALGLAWETTMALLFLGARDYRISAQELEAKRQEFSRLNHETSRSVLELYQSRKSAAAAYSDQHRLPQLHTAGWKFCGALALRSQQAELLARHPEQSRPAGSKLRSKPTRLLATTGPPNPAARSDRAPNSWMDFTPAHRGLWLESSAAIHHFVTATPSTVTSSSAAFGRWAFGIGQPRRDRRGRTDTYDWRLIDARRSQRSWSRAYMEARCSGEAPSQ